MRKSPSGAAVVANHLPAVKVMTECFPQDKFTGLVPTFSSL